MQSLPSRLDASIVDLTGLSQRGDFAKAAKGGSRVCSQKPKGSVDPYVTETFRQTPEEAFFVPSSKS